MSEDVIPPTDLDRLLSSFRKLVRAEFPQLTYMGIFEYAIEATDGTTVDCSPTDTSIPLPSLAKVPLRASTLGSKVTPSAITGARCLVAFINADPTKPFVISIDTKPSVAVIDADVAVQIGQGAVPAARLGDLAGIFPIVTTQVKVLI